MTINDVPGKGKSGLDLNWELNNDPTNPCKPVSAHANYDHSVWFCITWAQETNKYSVNIVKGDRKSQNVERYWVQEDKFETLEAAKQWCRYWRHDIQ